MPTIVSLAAVAYLSAGNIMTDIQNFLAMGGYAPYVWPAWGLTLGVFALMLVATLRGRRARRREERDLAALARPRRTRQAASRQAGP
jgi:heme exporter protein D